jgi:hypothetical protein
MIEHSEVMLAFAKSLEEADKPAKNPYQEDVKQIEEKRIDPKEDLVEIAHPEPIYVAESHGDGGLVENQNEQHEKIMTVINRMPTGALLGTYASTVESLVKLANECDELGDSEAADKLTEAARKVLALMDVLPFDCGAGNDSRVSPLTKEAGPIGALAKGIGWLAGDGLKIAKVLGSKAAEIGVDVGSKLGDWWKAGKEVVPVAEDIVSDIGKVLATKSEAATQLTANLTAANQNLEKITDAILIAKQSMKDATDLAKADKDIAVVKQIQGMLKGEENLSLLPQVQGEITSLLDSLRPYGASVGAGSPAHAAAESIEQANSIAQKVLASKSANLNSDTAFFKEYINLTKPENKAELDLWAANPDNAAKLKWLMNNPFRAQSLKEMVAAGKMPIRNQLLGITAEQQATRLGVASLGASGALLASVYGWFHKNDPQQIQSQVQEEIKDPINQVRTYGPGQDILSRVKTSTDDIISLEQMADEGLSNNPALLTKYVSGMSQELKVLADAVNQWDVVEANAEDKNIAQQAKQQIITFLADRIGAFNELAGIVGVPTVSAPAATSNTTDDNVSKIQELLKVPSTGVLDAQTTQALRDLEQKFNQKAKDTRFTGAFVDPSAQKAIDYKDLQEAFNRIQKY